MSVASVTNGLVRLLVRNDETQFTAAFRLVEDAAAAQKPVLLMVCALLETEWVLRSRYKLDKSAVSCARGTGHPSYYKRTSSL